MPPRTKAEHYSKKFDVIHFIFQPDLSAYGEYKCSLKWAFEDSYETIVMTSQTARISLEGFVTQPVTTNVAKGILK